MVQKSHVFFHPSKAVRFETLRTRNCLFRRRYYKVTFFILGAESFFCKRRKYFAVQLYYYARNVLKKYFVASFFQDFRKHLLPILNQKILQKTVVPLTAEKQKRGDY